MAQRATHHSCRGRDHIRGLGARQRSGRSRVVHPSFPERLIGVDVANARHQLLIKEGSLDDGIAPAHPRHDIGQVKVGFERVATDVGDLRW